jgi:hypothetical protein
MILPCNAYYMDEPPQIFSPHPRVEALVSLLPTRRAGSRRMEWDGGRHAARCEARGARNLVCGLSRRRQEQARSHGAAPAVAGTLAARPCRSKTNEKDAWRLRLQNLMAHRSTHGAAGRGWLELKVRTVPTPASSAATREAFSAGIMIQCPVRLVFRLELAGAGPRWLGRVAERVGRAAL